MPVTGFDKLACIRQWVLIGNWVIPVLDCLFNEIRWGALDIKILLCLQCQTKEIPHPKCGKYVAYSYHSNSCSSCVDNVQDKSFFSGSALYWLVHIPYVTVIAGRVWAQTHSGPLHFLAQKFLPKLRSTGWPSVTDIEQIKQVSSRHSQAKVNRFCPTLPGFFPVKRSKCCFFATCSDIIYEV